MTIKNKNVLIALLISTIFCLSGCTVSDDEKELAAFSQSIVDFAEQIKTLDSDMEKIDVNSETASADILSHLDSLDESFASLASLEVPKQYASIETLANEASENMSQAVVFYHSAYDSDSFNEQDAEIAYEYYTRAMTRINYIGIILEGEIPEGDNVTVYETSASNEIIDKLTK